MASRYHGLADAVEVLRCLNVGSDPSPDLLYAGFSQLLRAPAMPARDVILGAILSGTLIRGPSAHQIVALIRAALALDGLDVDRPRPLHAAGSRTVAAIGSGKKGVKTLNITTLSAIVAATVGARVLKPGSRGFSSVSGSADFMRAVGMDIDLTPTAAAAMLDTLRFSFVSVEQCIPRFNSIYGQRFAVPTALSFGLPAVIAPIATDAIHYGLAHPRVDLAAEVLRLCGCQHVLVVSATHDGLHYLDEIGVYGETNIVGVRAGVKGPVRRFQPTRELGLPAYEPADIHEGRNLAETVAMGIRVLLGRGKPAHEDCVCINAANILFLADLAEDLRDGFTQAKRVIRGGGPFELLREVVRHSGGDPHRLTAYHDTRAQPPRR